MSVIFFVFPNIKKQANLQLPLNIQKLEVFGFRGALCPLVHRSGLLSFAYCFIDTVS